MTGGRDLLARAEDLIVHRPPALLVAGPRSLTPDGGSVVVAPHAGLDGLQLIEVAAQSLAVLMGCRLSGGGAAAGERAAGMLVGLKDVVVRRDARPGEEVLVEAVRDCVLGEFRLYRVTVRGDGGEPLLTGEQKIFSRQRTEDGT
jgi:predicted hotdog family 3-hydroxylacyl-ACP dehydratase